MSPRVRAVLELVSEMTAEERAELRNKLGSHVGEAEWTASWNDALSSRMAQIERGDVELLTEEEFFDDGE
jgi:hypothetical protein